MAAEIHPDFRYWLDMKEQPLINLYKGLRDCILDVHPEYNELLYHTHALTSVYSISDKLSDGFCLIPIYSNHLNLGFHKGTLLNDPNKLLQGTGKLIRHIPIKNESDYKNNAVLKLINISVEFAIEDMDKPTTSKKETISRIKN